MKKITLFLSAALVLSSLSAASPFTPVSPEALKSWRDARFGMFIHWGPVSLTGREIGWSRGGRQTPIEEYDNLYKRFNPAKFDADEWVAVAKAAGMKYMVLTTKHHDGFCLWDTKQTDYNIMNTPFGRDVVKELSAACKKGGIGFGTYYSTCDWYHTDFPVTSPGGRVKRDKSDLDAYTKYLKAQSKELLTNYGPLFTLWYDVPQYFDVERGAGVINMVRALQPDIVVNNRTGAAGDYDTPEQKIGSFQMDRPWETCMTICRQWAWKPNDRMKSLEECLHTLILTNGGDGNLLFNVGPMPNGEIEARQVDRLKQMGAWLEKNGETLYGTRGGPWKPSSRMASTRKGNKIFLHVLPKLTGPVRLPAPPVKIVSAKLWGGPAVTMKEEAGFVIIDLPEELRAPMDTIIELTVEESAMGIPVLGALMGNAIPGSKASASVTYSPEYTAAMAFDDESSSRWATPKGTRNCWLQLDLPAPQQIGYIEIDEAYAHPKSRVMKFELQKKDGDVWKTIHTGKGLGEHFSVEFPQVRTTGVRLNILDASEGPTISELRLFPSKP